MSLSVSSDDLYEGTCQEPYSRTMRETLSRRNMKAREARQGERMPDPILPVDAMQSEQGKLEACREATKSSLASNEANGSSPR